MNTDIKRAASEQMYKAYIVAKNNIDLLWLSRKDSSLGSYQMLQAQNKRSELKSKK